MPTCCKLSQQHVNMCQTCANMCQTCVNMCQTCVNMCQTSTNMCQTCVKHESTCAKHVSTSVKHVPHMCQTCVNMSNMCQHIVVKQKHVYSYKLRALRFFLSSYGGFAATKYIRQQTFVWTHAKMHQQMIQ